MNVEIRPLPGWSGCYRVSSRGEVFGPRGKPLKGYRDKNGYRCVYIGLRKQGIAIKVHRAVVATFIGPIPEGMQINHKNGVKNDNRLENLEIVTPSQNAQHAYQVLGVKGHNTNPSKGEAHHHSRLTVQEILEIRTLYDEGWTQVKLAEKFTTPQTNISRIIRRTAWAHV